MFSSLLVYCVIIILFLLSRLRITALNTFIYDVYIYTDIVVVVATVMLLLQIGFQY